ncbi:unnamed protein product [Malassezia sympodialis ATCC 42132]|uniref:Similar to S.cerevisiae protein NEM1 (Probable catalytic subunit of Nem1p-Spo7p phosphatase holoenzyme) n=1 Tax=Malassezia sympodialis (strain ATCC 42132) TaxID=1230383 RepID=M5EM79_MALS4|nr:uncharacterized protein MSY001_1483 [Malassezia sympodialis ATCC 42132]CCU98777.1 unnamed protein product [Malassezia sympodialis ATCC 42132]SHO77419.1 Similar to S.cerevisiae protein NEM1 (Probable catalytic subunit of Nem1p-Spo7p phosphatase holoenzyme) [Malassezia sympodialis ATCC 42132]|eukprot:XP_018740061.1 uncharacterized protein MSY001_1483 [Malassezia sympodialis ATCC 42132]
MDAERDAPPDRASSSALPTVEALVQGRRARAQGRAPPRDAPAVRVPRGLSSVIQQTPKVLVLDLDETLIHSKLSAAPWGRLGARDPVGASVSTALLSILGLGATVPPHAQLQLRVIEVQIEGRTVVYQVYKRPWVDYFLRKVAAWYQVVIFTASVKEYANPVIDWLDGGHGLISGRLFRDSCTLRNGSYLKNLQVVERDLSRVCLIDNSPMSYVLQEANGIPVEAWTHDPRDEALLDLLPMLDGLRYASDVRHILGLRGF